MSMYGAPQRGKGSMMLPANASSNLSIVSPTTQATIKLQEVQIPSEQIWQMVFKSPYNTRNQSLLTEATVLKILPTIRKDGRNTVPVLAVKHEDGRYEILSGMKRSFAVSISPSCNLVIHYALNSEVSDADKAALTKTFDAHEKPSFLDVALSIKEYQSTINKSCGVRELAEIFGISKSSVSDLQRISELPFELFNLYPSAAHVGRNFLVSVAKLNLSNEAIVERISGLEAVKLNIAQINDEHVEERLLDEVGKLNEAILSRLKAKSSSNHVSQKSFSSQSPFYQKRLVDGVKAAPASRGQVVLTLDKSFLESEIGKQLIESITEGKNS